MFQIISNLLFMEIAKRLSCALAPIAASLLISTTGCTDSRETAAIATSTSSLVSGATILSCSGLTEVESRLEILQGAHLELPYADNVDPERVPRCERLMQYQNLSDLAPHCTLLDRHGTPTIDLKCVRSTLLATPDGCRILVEFYDQDAANMQDIADCIEAHWILYWMIYEPRIRLFKPMQ
jgi:hypothetical protein